MTIFFGFISSGDFITGSGTTFCLILAGDECEETVLDVSDGIARGESGDFSEVLSVT
jgi:hypothetical protein